MLSIENDTPIMPCVVADSVVEHVEAHFGIALGRSASDRLVEHQAALYTNSATWRKKMRAKGDKGRDTLYAFMLHWLAADIEKTHPQVSRRIGSAAWYGTPL